MPWSGRSPGGGNGNPFQDSCLGSPKDRGVWGAAVHGVTKSWARLRDSTITITSWVTRCSVGCLVPETNQSTRQKPAREQNQKATTLQTNPWISWRILSLRGQLARGCSGPPGGGAASARPTSWGERSPLHLTGKASFSGSGARCGCQLPKPALPEPPSSTPRSQAPKPGAVS